MQMGKVIALPGVKLPRKPKHTWTAKVAACLKMAELLPASDVDFLEGMSGIVKDRDPTVEQCKRIDDIIRVLRQWCKDN